MLTVDWTVGASIVVIFSGVIALAVAYLRLYVGGISKNIEVRLDHQGMKIDKIESNTEDLMTKDLADEKFSSLHRRIEALERWIFQTPKGQRSDASK